MHSIIPHVVAEQLLCDRNCYQHLGFISEQGTKISAQYSGWGREVLSNNYNMIKYSICWKKGMKVSGSEVR